MAALAFNPQLPLAQPAPRTGGRLRLHSWGRARLQHMLAELAVAASQPEPGFVVAVRADALLDSPGAIAALAASGCAELVVEFTTLGPSGDARASRLAGLVETIHAHGLRVHARFTLGFDHDTPECFEALVAWVEARRIASVELSLWTPEPGSSLTRGLAEAKRVRHTNFAHWDGAHVVITPAQMSEQTLYRGWVWTQLQLASLRSAWRRRPPGVGPALGHLLRAVEATLLPWRAQRRRQRMLP